MTSGERSRLLMFGLLTGVLAGIAKLIKVYDWRTTWVIPAPREDVYRVFIDAEAERTWWPSMEILETSPGDLVEGSRSIIRVHQAPSVRRLAPPFRLESVFTHVEPNRRLRQIVTGDLVGALEIHFEDLADGGTQVTFDWYVRMGNPVLNLLGYVLTPVYAKSHDGVMREGEAGLRAYMAAKGGQPSAASSQP
jgi:uncharacterized protein YndB with AHSA1/START domain